VCQLTVEAPSSGAGGILTLVDCAGSERKEDSMYHSAQRRKEGAEINASLYALKECIRATIQKQRAPRGKHIHIPFRSSNLTKVLMESFLRDDAQIALIATLSPTPTDTEHSLSTLNTAAMLSGRTHQVTEATTPVELNEPKEEQLVSPAQWPAARVREWLASSHGGKFAPFVAALPGGLTGKQLMRLLPAKLAGLVLARSTNMSRKRAADLGQLVFDALRKAVTRVQEQKARKVKDIKQARHNEKYEKW
jgi:kinesin family protein 2/24